MRSVKSQHAMGIALAREQVVRQWAARPELTARLAVRVFRAGYKQALALLLGRAPEPLGFSERALVQWRQAYREKGVEGLAFRTSPGRAPKLALSPHDKKVLRFWRLKKRSVRLAVENAVESGKLTAQAAQGLEHILATARGERRDPVFPPCVVKACRVTREAQELERGGKAYQNYEAAARRLMAWRDEATGELIPLGPLDLYESDDESENGHFRWNDAETGEPMLGRQTLKTVCVQSAGLLGASWIGRERDAYRAEDIAEHMLSIVHAWGLPLAWRLEKGTWDGSFIHGVKLEPALARKAGMERWGGLDALFRVMNVHRSRSKGAVEGAFNHLQNLAAHETPDIGRAHGDNERATKLLLRAYRGDAAALAQFPHITEKAALMAEIIKRYNGELKTRQWLGGEKVSPAELLAEATPRRLPEGEAWRFLPIKRLATVQRNLVGCTVPHYGPIKFWANAMDGLVLAHNYPVLIAFHPAKPHEGCHIFNGAPVGDRSNTEGWAFGQFLGVAPREEAVAQFGPVDAQQAGYRKKCNASHRSEHRSYGQAAGMGRSLSVAQARNGARYEVNTGAAPLVDATAEAQRETPPPPARPGGKVVLPHDINSQNTAQLRERLSRPLEEALPAANDQ